MFANSRMYLQRLKHDIVWFIVKNGFPLFGAELCYIIRPLRWWQAWDEGVKRKRNGYIVIRDSCRSEKSISNHLGRSVIARRWAAWTATGVVERNVRQLSGVLITTTIVVDTPPIYGFRTLCTLWHSYDGILKSGQRDRKYSRTRK